jgi:hypothetical protein
LHTAEIACGIFKAVSFMGAVMREAMTRLSLRDGVSRRVWGVFGLVLFLSLQIFTASEPLHKLIHSDADSASHQCAVTLFSHGQVNAVETVAVVALFVAPLFFLLPPLQSVAISSFDFRFSSSRAPPRF